MLHALSMQPNAIGVHCFYLFHQSDLCGTHTSKRPYSELGSVDRGNCLCCVSVESAIGPISPGCGCDERRVDEIVFELKHRMEHRGDAAQMRQAELTLMRLEHVDAKLDAIMAQLKIPQSMEMEERLENRGFR